MGDFVKGRIPEYFSPGIRQGLHLHRRIDSFSHSNAHTRRSRQALDPKYGHGRCIIVDIFYDHFLASTWDEYSTEPLEQYAERVYTLLRQHHQLLPHALKSVASRMIKYNWLVSYREFEVVGKALERIAERLSRPLPLGAATDDLARRETFLRDDFRAFMNEAQGFLRRESLLIGN